MKKKTFGMLMTLLFCLFVHTCALAYDADIAEAWLTQFAQALHGMSPINDPAATTDPARGGQLLLAYEFGTVLTRQDPPAASDIFEIEVRTDRVRDCRGVRVGMGMDRALDGAHVGASTTQLYVLDVQNTGWNWAYVKNGSVYGVEYIAYGGQGTEMKEYTLTYVIENNVVSAIRMKIAPATQAQADEGLRTASEIALRQHGEVLAVQSGAEMFSHEDLTVNGGTALGRPVYELIAYMGEPREIQTLPEGKGRILIYEGAAVRLELDDRTGVEVVRGVSVTDDQTVGPRRLSVGLSAQEAASLFRCEQEVSSLGGWLYLGGESMDDPPYGHLTVSGGEKILIYACTTNTGEVAMLEAGISDGTVSYWRLYYRNDAEGGI